MTIYAIIHSYYSDDKDYEEILAAFTNKDTANLLVKTYNRKANFKGHALVMREITLSNYTPYGLESEVFPSLFTEENWNPYEIDWTLENKLKA